MSSKSVSYNPDWIQHQPGNQNANGTYRRAKLPDTDFRAEWTAEERSGEATLSGAPQAERQKPQRERVPLNEYSSDSFDPAIREYHTQCIEAIDGFAGQEARCKECGKCLLADFRVPRVTVLYHEGTDDNHIEFYCRACYTAPPQQGGDDHDGLTPLQRDVRRLRLAGRTQEEIARELSTPGHPLTQRKVSRMLVKIRKILNGRRRSYVM